MLTLLLFLACAAKTETDVALVGDATAGGELYAVTCAACHNDDGSGGVDVGGTLSADHRVRVPASTDDQLRDVIMNGFGTAMPGQYQDEQEVADVLAYLRLTFP